MPFPEHLRASWGVTEMGHPGNAALDPRPYYRVANFGLGHKLQRLTEIVLRHARHNQYRFELSPSRGPGEYDIAMVDMTVRGGPEVANTLRQLPQARPVVKVGRRNDEIRGHDDLLRASFTMNLLATLNRVVEERLLTQAAHRRQSAPPAARLRVAETSAAPPTATDGDIQDTITQLPTRRPRVLVVDDSPTVRRQLAVAMHRMGLDSEGVSSAREALDTLATRRYELVFVDVVMPEMDGYQLTREIKRSKLLRPMPVVILTSRSSPFDLARGALAGCNSYLVKPVSLQSLRETVARQLHRSAGRLTL
ncbi:MAG TPA: response regulator [Burkholderiaceae bacterium]|jgi:twitching motility two-component system response regulator PilG|nr:response regulator [Burkholderiaceae bacterium]